MQESVPASLPWTPPKERMLCWGGPRSSQHSWPEGREQGRRVRQHGQQGVDFVWPHHSHCSHESDQAPAVGLCSSVFLPLHNLGGLQADSEAPRHAPTRQMADLIREDLLPRRPQPFFLLVWPCWPTTCS